MAKPEVGTDEWYDGLIAAVEGALRLGPMDADELAWGLVEDGWLTEDDSYEPSDELLTILSGIDGFWVTGHQMIADDAQLLDGLCLTRRLTDEEVERGSLLLGTDLELHVWTVAGRTLPWSEGGDLSRRVDDPSADTFIEWLEGPDGWLGDVSAGDLIALVRTRRGLAVVAVDEIDEKANELAAAMIAEAFASRVPSGQGEELPVVLMDALVVDDDILRSPVLPVSELIVLAGLEQDGILVGRADEDWEREDRRRIRERLEDVRERYGYDECCADALRGVVMAWALAFEDGSPSPVVKQNEMLAHLAHGDVAGAFVDVALGFRSRGDVRLERFATVLGPRGSTVGPGDLHPGHERRSGR